MSQLAQLRVHAHPGLAPALPVVPLTHPEAPQLEVLEDHVAGGRHHRLPAHSSIGHVDGPLLQGLAQLDAARSSCTVEPQLGPGQLPRLPDLIQEDSYEDWRRVGPE